MRHEQGDMAAQEVVGELRPNIRLRGWLRAKARGAARHLSAKAVRHGAPPSWFGYRHIEAEAARDCVARMRAKGFACAGYETIHEEAIASNALPLGVTSSDDLPDDRGWWGYSMRDVPNRVSGETFIATIPNARILAYIDEKKRFFPAILSCDDTAINLREIVFRERHGALLRTRSFTSRTPERLARATWIMERVYDNHSHWLTAHLPKLCLLRERGLLGDVILPQALKPSMESSLTMMGLDPSRFRTFDTTRPLEVAQLTILGTDRFRPELLRSVRDAIAPPAGRLAPTRRVYISRSKARFRRLLNEDEIWPLFEQAGFERVYMEDIGFPEQVRLMAQTKVLAAPHGAGLTNMMFCAEGAQVVEIAWLGFPNPNFYGLAAAMGHDYAIVPAEARGDVAPLEQDLVVAPERVRAVLERLVEPSSRAAGIGEI